MDTQTTKKAKFEQVKEPSIVSLPRDIKRTILNYIPWLDIAKVGNDDPDADDEEAKTFTFSFPAVCKDFKTLFDEELKLRMDDGLVLLAFIYGSHRYFPLILEIETNNKHTEKGLRFPYATLKTKEVARKPPVLAKIYEELYKFHQKKIPTEFKLDFFPIIKHIKRIHILLCGDGFYYKAFYKCVRMEFIACLETWYSSKWSKIENYGKNSDRDLITIGTIFENMRKRQSKRKMVLCFNATKMKEEKTKAPHFRFLMYKMRDMLLGM